MGRVDALGTEHWTLAEYTRHVTGADLLPPPTPVKPKAAGKPRRGVRAGPAELARQAAIGGPVVQVMIPAEPGSKERARKGAGGHWYTPEETKLAEDHVGRILAAAMGPDRPYEFGPVVVHAIWYGADVAGKDIDNLTKLLYDAANGIVWRDDVQIEEDHHRRVLDAARPRTLFRVAPSGVPYYRPCARCGAWTRNAVYCARRCPA